MISQFIRRMDVVKQNKRKEVRVSPHELEPVEVQIIGDGFLEILPVKDIGPSGIGVNVAHGFQGLNIVREVEVVITIPKEKSFKARGVIKHKRQFKNHNDEQGALGIHFTQICNRHRRVLENYVEERLSDKRTDIRIEPSSDEPVEVQLAGEEIPPFYRLKDISSGGMCVYDCKVNDNSIPGNEIDFLLKLPSGKSMQITGKLKYENRPENCVGISFESLTDDQREAIEKYICSRIQNMQTNE